MATFHDPHPGFLGAAVPLPAAVKKVADDLDGKTMPLDEAIALIKAAAPDGEVIVRADAVLLKMKGDGVRHAEHMWRVIKFTAAV
jgi:hypothetical protein